MIRAAVVGGGQIATKVYLPTLAAMDDVELAVLVEPDPARREAINRKYRFAAAVASVDELSEGQADAAFLLTPHEDRREPLTRLMELGMDVFSEKPMAADLPQAE
ncbi:MAG: Gfo/Idh/MocA family protein, partial [Planctomycetota bacterium]